MGPESGEVGGGAAACGSRCGGGLAHECRLPPLTTRQTLPYIFPFTHIGQCVVGADHNLSASADGGQAADRSVYAK